MKEQALEFAGVIWGQILGMMLPLWRLLIKSLPLPPCSLGRFLHWWSLGQLGHDDAAVKNLPVA